MLDAQRKLGDGTIAQGVVVLQPSGGVYDASETKIQFADTTNLDAFGRLRVSNGFTIFDSQQEYGLDTIRTWDASANGTFALPSSNASAVSGSNSVGPTDLNTRMTPIAVSATAGHYSVLQSRQYMRYIPGKSHLVLMTGIFAHTPDCTMSVAIRTSTSGSPVDNEVVQENWNIDKFDGEGPSGIQLDFSKTQILFIQAQWLGVGRVIVGFSVDGVMYPAHEFLNANRLVLPYTQTFNLPIRMEGRTVTGETSFRSGYFDGANGVFLKAAGIAGGVVQFNCASCDSEDSTFTPGAPWATPLIGTAAVTARRPIISIRPKATFNGRVNRAHIEMVEYTLRTSTNDASVEIVVGGVLTGANFQSVDVDSAAEYDVSATAITGGRRAFRNFSISGQGSFAERFDGEAHTTLPLTISQIDSALNSQVVLSVVATSFSGTSNNEASLHWHEQII